MDFFIRPVELEDAVAINTLRRMDGVFENLLAIPSERIESTTEYLESLTDRDFVFVAETKIGFDPLVIACAALAIRPQQRERHRADFGIMVHRDYQGMGVGTALMEKLIDLADNWLMIKRIDLTVMADNRRAIALYERMGFEIEATSRYAVIKKGRYADEVRMARLNGV